MIITLVIGMIMISISFIYKNKVEDKISLKTEKISKNDDITKVLRENQSIYLNVIQGMLARVSLLEEAMLELHDISQKNNKIINNIDKKINNNSSRQGFSTAIEDVSAQTMHQEIYDLYLQGVAIEEIAELYQRGKGEIQLILSLQKSKNS